MGADAKRRSLVRRWDFALGGYWALLAAWFVAIAFYAGPNWLLFGKLRRITPADFADDARRELTPLILAAKAYQADHGEIPVGVGGYGDASRLLGDYLPSRGKNHVDWLASIEHGVLKYPYGRFNHAIEYDLHPATEGWRVRGPFTSGPIPLPLVTYDAAATRPTTRPR